MNPDTKSWINRLLHWATSRPKNQEELLEILSEATKERLLETGALNMIQGVLKVYSLEVRDIMIPRSQMVVVEASASLEEILPIMTSSGHSRFPVIQEDKDEIIGILLAKDVLWYMANPQKPFNLSELLRPVTFIPESKKLSRLLEEFRLKRNHMAIVVDEYGSIAGMLTIEDVLEEIVGEIEDEYDTDTQTDITALEGNTYQIKALTPIQTFNDFFNTRFPNTNFDTIGGLVTSYFGYLPKRDESITIDGFEFKVLHSDKRKIRLLQVMTNPK